ncbi:REP-associated tyrosine transposase [Methylomonas sp. MgM2]
MGNGPLYRWRFAGLVWRLLVLWRSFFGGSSSGDDDFSNRWEAIKIRFVQKIPAIERRSKARTHKGERGIRQRRFWEHAIRDERDYANHIDYVHLNPLKHGYVTRVKDWSRFPKAGSSITVLKEFTAC